MNRAAWVGLAAIAFMFLEPWIKPYLDRRPRPGRPPDLGENRNQGSPGPGTLGRWVVNDLTLAVLGIGLGVGWFAGWTMALAWRKRNPTRQEKLARRIYRHVDDIIGATKHENQLRADKRFALTQPHIHLRRPWKNWPFLVPGKEWWADRFWPEPRLAAGANPIPSDQRIAWYIQISPDMRTYSIRYSPEAAAQYDQFVTYLTRGTTTMRGGGGLASALGREWSPNLFQVERDWSAGQVRLTLNHKTDVPAEASAAEALN